MRWERIYSQAYLPRSVFLESFSLKRFKKLLTALLATGVAALLLLAAFGLFMKAADKPHKADIIVSLGGGDGRRIKIALALYQKGFSRSGKFLYTGREIVNPALSTAFSKTLFLEKNGVPAENIVYIPRGVIFNTAEELFFIKDYMRLHGYKSVLIVSSPSHARRIKTIAGWIADFHKTDLTYYVTAYHEISDNPLSCLWNKEERKEYFLEFEKLIYNLLKYSPLTIDKTSYAKKRNTPLWQETLRGL